MALLLLLFLFAFGPGPVLVAPLRLAPRQRLVAAVGAGLFLEFVLAFIVFATHLPLRAHFGVTGVVLALTVLSLPQWRRLWRVREVRRLLFVWAALLVWSLLLLSLIRHYGGGTWGGDWVEHFERTAFFQGLLPEDYRFIQQYPLPMRPPMMNVLCASLFQVVDESNYLASFQVVFTFLNSLIVLPLATLLPRVWRLSTLNYRRSLWTLSALLAASPMFCQNVTYAWTKLFAGFYALAAMSVYMTAWRRDRHLRPVGPNSEAVLAVPESNDVHTRRRAGVSNDRLYPLAFGLICAGFLVHFSVGPYGLFLGLHFLAAVWLRRQGKIKLAAAIGGTSLAILATWFAWSIGHYGSKTTFTSTSAVSDSVKMTPAENALNVAKNVGNTLLPTIVRSPGWLWTEDLDQPGEAGRVRDYTFLIYQVSLPGGLGCMGVVVAIALLIFAVRRRQSAAAGALGRVTQSMGRFWLAYALVVFAAGVAVYGGIDRFGVAHICLQPMILTGLALVAAGIWSLGVRWRSWLLVGLLLDAALGVFLQMTLEHRQLLAIPQFGPDGTTVVGYGMADQPGVPSRAAQNNQMQKLMYVPTYGGYFGDLFDDAAFPFQMFAAGGTLAFLLFMGLAGPTSRRANDPKRQRPADKHPANKTPGGRTGGRSRKRN